LENSFVSLKAMALATRLRERPGGFLFRQSAWCRLKHANIARKISSRCQQYRVDTYPLLCGSFHERFA